MEVKTLEEYFLHRMNVLETELENVKADLEYEETKYDALLSEYNKLVDTICRIATVRVSADNTTMLVDFENVWESWDKEDYEYLKSLLERYGKKEDE